MSLTNFGISASGKIGSVAGGIAGTNLIAEAFAGTAPMTTAAFTTVTGRLYVMWVSGVESGTPAAITSVSSHSMTWTLQAQAGSGANDCRIWCYYGIEAGAGGSDTMVVTNSATWDFGGRVLIDEFTGIDTAAPVVQSAVATSAAATTLTATLAAFGSANNATAGGFMHSVGSAGNGTVGSGFTELGDLSSATTYPHSLYSEYKSSNDTSVDASWSASQTCACIGIEIKAA